MTNETMNAYRTASSIASKASGPSARLFKLLAVSAAVSVLAACSTVAPSPLAQKDLSEVNQADRNAMRKDVEPLTGPLTLDEALARALKYNLDRRARLMEEAIAFQQLDVTKLDMLPKLVAQAGYNHRNRERATFSQSYNPVDPFGPIGSKSTSASFSQETTHNTVDLGLTWSLLDFGLGKASAQQAADRVLISGEKRRKAMHVLMQDVRTAYWRAASAQKLRSEVGATLKMAEEALVDARKAEAERLRNPLDSLRYQRQLLENLRLLEAIDQELSTAQVELASLINAPVGQAIAIAENGIALADDTAIKLPMARLEEVALENNADLREQHYNGRIAAEEVRKTMTRLFPNLSFSYGVKYDSDNYLVHNNWNEAGLQLSFNLVNLFTGSTQIKLAEAGVSLADQRRMATQMAVITQVHLARLQLANARSQFSRADAIYTTDQKIAEQVRTRQSVQAQSQLDRVANETTAILSLLRRYQALSQVHMAENRLMANLGLEPKIGSTGDLTLAELTQQVKGSGNPWAALQQPAAGK
jgi:outer membrane protein TolC